MRSKVSPALFALVFALVFGAGGYFGVATLIGQLREWRAMQSWQSTSATVLEARLQTSHGDDSTTYEATTRYRYVVDGRKHHGTRVGISSGSDNVGSWQNDRHAQLAAAQRSGQPITIWFDTANPKRSIVDRTLRWPMIVFMIPFATLFPMVSLGALWMFFRILRKPSVESAAPEPAKNPAVIESNAGSELRKLWLFATFWGLIAFPLAFLFISESFGRSWIWVFVAIFPLIGLWLIWLALSRTLRLWLHGEITLALQPSQPRLGEALALHMTFSKSPTPGEYAISLLCEQVDTRGEDTSYTEVWRHEHTVQVNGSYAATSFSPTDNLPGSEPVTGIYHRWRVLLNFPGGKDERAFDILMQPAQTSGMASDAEPDFSRHSGDDATVRAIPPTGRNSPVTAESRIRTYRWIKHGLELLVVTVILTIGWQVVGGFFTDKPSAAKDLQVERPRSHSTARSSDRSLHDAIAHHDAEAVSNALAAGANVDATNDWGGTPLIVASRFGDTDIVKHLLDAGADVNFHVIAKNEYQGRTALMNAAWQADGPTVALLLDAGADARAFESHGWSAAHYAARSGNIATLRTLHERGVDLDLPSPENRGETPLMIAAHFGEIESIKELIKLGANPRATDNHGENVYGWAKHSQQSVAMQVLKSYQ